MDDGKGIRVGHRGRGSKRSKPATVRHARVGKVAIVEELFGDIRLEAEESEGPALSGAFGRGQRPRLSSYGYEVPFVGRRAELKELRRFAAKGDAPDFAWWMWLAPGGQGKTRLAAQLCAELRAGGWKCGFLPHTSDYRQWHLWKVTTPTLLVVDHVASRADAVRDAICALSRDATRIQGPLRILLLDRPFETGDAWISDLVPFGSPQDLSDFFSFAYEPEGRSPTPDLSFYTRHLASLPDDDLRAIAMSVLSDNKTEPHLEAAATSIVNWLATVDPARRPIFLVLAARAMKDVGHTHLRHWNRRDVAEAVLTREYHLWLDTLDLRDSTRLSSERELFEEHLTLIVASTVTGRRDTGFRHVLRDFGIGVPDRLQPDWIRAITGVVPEGPEREFAPLSPDIVGECFVLERCLGGFGLDATRDRVRSQIQGILSAALAEAPWQTIDFVRRCIEDFGDHEGLGLIATMGIPKGKEANIGHLMDYVVHQGIISGLFAKAGRSDLAEVCWTQIIEWCQRLLSLHNSSFSGMVREYLARAYHNRGLERFELGRSADGFSDLKQAQQHAELNITGLEGRERLQAAQTRFDIMMSRATLALRTGDTEAARSTLSQILEDEASIGENRARALILRANVTRRIESVDEGIADVEAVISMPNIANRWVKTAKTALAGLLLLRSSQRTPDSAVIADLDRAASLVDLATELGSTILVNRGAVKMREGHLATDEQLHSARHDCSAVIENRDAPVEQRVKALINRAQINQLLRDPGGAHADIDEGIKLSEQFGRDHVSAVLVRAQLRGLNRDVGGAIADLEWVIENAHEDAFRQSAITLLPTYRAMAADADYLRSV